MEKYTFNIEFNTKVIIEEVKDEDNAWNEIENYVSDLLEGMSKTTGLDFDAEWTIEDGND